MTCLNETDPLTLIWIAGDDEEFVINYLDGDRKPVDLTGSVITMQLRIKPSSPSPSLELTASWDEVTGKIIFEASSIETRSLLTSSSYSKYVYDVQIVDGNLKTKTIVGGTIVVKIDITR